MKLILTTLLISSLLVISLSSQTSESDERYSKFLDKFPESDLNHDGVLTRDEVRQFNQVRKADKTEKQEKQKPPVPSHADVKYGPHKQQAFDVWLANSPDGKPTPVCIYIHGGGFRGGDKSGIQAKTIQRFLDKGISFISMNYRLTNGGEFPYPTAMHDAARGLQTIRSKAKEWNLDKRRIASHGGSAGAGISLWLAFHEDLAEPKSKDPVARQSTRLVAAATTNGQSTYDMRTFREWFGVPDLPPHDALVAFYGMQEGDTPDTPRVVKLAEDASAINHLTKDDPPVFMNYGSANTPVTRQTSQGAWVHHPLLGLKLQEKMHLMDMECIVTAKGIEDDTYEDMYDFLIQKLLK